MYGMEMSVLLPLLGPVAVHAARPFFPEDVAQALSHARATAHPGGPRPVHLRALLGFRLQRCQPLRAIVSANRSAHAELAAEAESPFRVAKCARSRLDRNLRDRTPPHRARNRVDAAAPACASYRSPTAPRCMAPHLEAPVVLAGPGRSTTRRRISC
jgi:hypothetical protein